MRKSQTRKTNAARVAKPRSAARVAKLRSAAPTAKPSLAALSARQKLTPRDGSVCLGVLTGWDEHGPLVEFEGNTRGPVRARACAGSARPAVGSEVVLLVGSALPVVLGVLQPLDAPLEARIDGRRVELDGRDEIVLRCGEASITLRRNGRVVIRGVQVETRATGVNRIKGGSVSIN
jgi:hypothetical protein